MRTSQRITTIALAGGLLVAGGPLAACGSTVENAAEQAAGEAIGGDVDLDLENGGISVTNSDGTSVQIGGNAAIPDTWPAAIPVFTAGPLLSVTSDADGSSVSAVWSTDLPPDEAIASYDATLKGAGFASTENVVVGLASARYTGSGYTVSVLATEADGKTTLVLSGEKTS